MAPGRSILLLALLSITLPAVAQSKRKPITIGSLIVNPDDIIAVFRTGEQQPVEVFLAKPGHAMQVIVFREFRESQAIFNELWANNDVSKDPGEDDARPLTRLRLKDTRGPTTLIANISRILAVVSGPDHRGIHIYLDRGSVAMPIPDPVNNAERDYLELLNANGEADTVIAAYKASLGG